MMGRPVIRARAYLALGLSAVLFAAVIFVGNDTHVSVLQESFYQLAQNSLTSEFDQMALSRAQELAEVPDQNSLLTDSLIYSSPVESKQGSVSPKGSKQSLSEISPEKSDPSMAGYRNFNDLLKESLEKEKEKRIIFHEELNKMGRKSPQYLKKVSEREKAIEASEKARQKTDAGALRRLEDHLDRHIAGILSLNEPHIQPKVVKDNSEAETEKYEKLERLHYEAHMKSMRLKRQLQMERADQKAKERLENQLNDDVGNILSTVVPGEHSTLKPESSQSVKEAQGSSSASSEKTSTVPSAESKALIKEVKSYIDREISNEVHSSVPVKERDAENNAAKELAKLRAYILAGKFQQAVKLAADQSGDESKSSEAKSNEAAKIAPSDQKTLSSFNALFGKLLKSEEKPQEK